MQGALCSDWTGGCPASAGAFAVTGRSLPFPVFPQLYYRGPAVKPECASGDLNLHPLIDSQEHSLTDSQERFSPLQAVISLSIKDHEL